MHRALLYRGLDEWLAGVVPWVREGLEADEAVRVTASPRKLRPLRDALDRDASAVCFEESAAVYRRLGPRFSGFERELMLRAGGAAPRLRVVAEHDVAGLRRSEADAYLRWEAVLNVAYAPHAVSVLCPYDTRALSADLIEGAACAHPELLEGGRVRRSESFTDPATFVARRTRPPGAPAHGARYALDHFSDLAGARAFVAARARDAGLPDDAVDELVVGANEVATNALAHADPLREVWVGVEDGMLVCLVSDGGPGLRDPFAGYLTPDDDTPGGRGLWLVNQLCDVVDVSVGPAGTTVALRTALGPP